MGKGPLSSCGPASREWLQRRGQPRRPLCPLPHPLHRRSHPGQQTSSRTERPAPGMSSTSQRGFTVPNVIQIPQGRATRRCTKASRVCLPPAPRELSREGLPRPLPALERRCATYLRPRPRSRRVHFPLLPGPDGGERCEVGVALPHLRQLLLLHLCFGKETRTVIACT